MAVRSVSMSADGSTLVAANNKGSIFAWKSVKSVGNSSALSLPPGSTGAKGSMETDYQPLFQLRAHSKYITKCLISPDTK